MKVTKQTQIHQKAEVMPQLLGLDHDIQKLFQALQGRLEFGNGTDGNRGVNIAGRFQAFTSNATPDTEDTVAHGLGATPSGELYIVMSQSKAGSLYKSGTAWDATNAYFKCDVASVAFKIFILP